MKKFNLSQLLLVFLLVFGSCQNETVENQIKVETINTSNEEYYIPKSVGKVIDAVYNGHKVKLLEVDNGKYLYDFDILLERKDFSLPGEFRGKGTFKGQNWDKKNIKWRYDISAGNNKDFKKMWETAMKKWNEASGITFKQVAPKFRGDYVLVGWGSPASSSIGRSGGEQSLTFNTGNNVGNVMHEIGHVLGLEHEHNRPDRDDYIIVKVKNIADQYLNQYDICKECKKSGKFDFKSIMLYGSKPGIPYVKKKNLVAMTKNDKKRSTWGANRSYISEGDKAAIKEKYK